jgi:uroporphyrin-3 C-methyltransferase
VVDVVGLYARFNALAGQAAALDAGPRVATKRPVANSEGWRDRAKAGWEAALAKLSSYLVVKRRDAEMARMMTPDWEALVRQNLRMLIEQAQIAALSHNPVLYAAALDRATTFVSEFAGVDPARVEAIGNELAALKQIDIAPALPDLTRSRAALADALMRLDDGELPGEMTNPPAAAIEPITATDTGSADTNGGDVSGVENRTDDSDTSVSTEG